MRRILVGAMVGIVVPALAFSGILHLAGERAQSAYLHVERVSEPLREDLTIAAADPALFPVELQHALLIAMHEGAADVPITAAVRTAWGQLSQGSERILIEVEGVLLVVESRADEGRFARMWGVVRREVATITTELIERAQSLS